MKKRLIMLFIFQYVFGVPLAINFQMVVKDESGKPVNFNGEGVTFTLLGDSGSAFWSETKSVTSPSGIINTLLGSSISIDPSQFYGQNSIKIVVTRANGDTLLKEPFNSIPYAFKANVADSSREAFLLRGKSPDDFLPVTFEATLKSSVIDSTTALRSAVSSLGTTLQEEIRDSSMALRSYVDSLDLAHRAAFRVDISDSILAHTGLIPTGAIHDTANSLRKALGDSASVIRSYAVSRDDSVKQAIRKDIGDSIAIHGYANNLLDSLPVRSPNIYHAFNFAFNGSVLPMTVPFTQYYIKLSVASFIEDTNYNEEIRYNSDSFKYTTWPIRGNKCKIVSTFSGGDAAGFLYIMFTPTGFELKNNIGTGVEVFAQISTFGSSSD